MGSTGKSTANVIRRLNFGKFLHGNAAEQHEFCQDLSYALCNVGFVKLINHGIDDEKLDQLFAWNAKFFALPDEAKAKAAHPPEGNPHRGYSYIGQEMLSRVTDFEKGKRESNTVFDVKESFDQGTADDDMYSNRWPDEHDLPGFRDFMEHFYNLCHHTHMELLRAIALSLELAPTYLQDLCDDNTSELRLNHYPSIDIAEVNKGAKRISEHTDHGTITLLFQDSVGGLEVEDQSGLGHYVPVPCESRSDMIVNIGDCLQRWTNDKFRSTSHRVTLPPGANSAGDRYSVAYFAKPNRTQSAGVLPHFIQAGVPPKYKDISVWEYNQEKLLRTY